MTRVRVESFTISLDGYGAGPDQSLANPLGVGGEELHQWVVPTRTFQRMSSSTATGSTGLDDDFAQRGFENVTGGIREALDRARESAHGKDIRIGGGASTIRQYLSARLIDEMHIAIAPILLGSGEALFDGLDLKALGYSCTRHVASENATHVIITRDQGA